LIQKIRGYEKSEDDRPDGILGLVLEMPNSWLSQVTLAGWTSGGQVSYLCNSEYRLYNSPSDLESPSESISPPAVVRSSSFSKTT
jgi:hypothetical protein